MIRGLELANTFILLLFYCFFFLVRVEMTRIRKEPEDTTLSFAFANETFDAIGILAYSLKGRHDGKMLLIVEQSSITIKLCGNRNQVELPMWSYKWDNPAADKVFCVCIVYVRMPMDMLIHMWYIDSFSWQYIQ